MQHYDRTTITEDPIRYKGKTYPRPTREELDKAFPRKQIVDADQHQREQSTGYGYAHRFSLRDGK